MCEDGMASIALECGARWQGSRTKQFHGIKGFESAGCLLKWTQKQTTLIRNIKV
jgi:hypothetical protein